MWTVFKDQILKFLAGAILAPILKAISWAAAKWMKEKTQEPK